MRPAGGAAGRHRPAVVVVAVLLVVAAVAVVAYRVLAPTEVSTPARGAYPAAPVPSRDPGVVGTLTAAPLIVDGRLRLYAATRQVRADLPLDAKAVRTPYWSFRRWPAELIGLVAAGTTVVSRWSDGELIGLDARTGRVSWRFDGPPPGHGYEGRRTGAGTVYTPDGLYTAVGRTGRAVLVVAGGSGLRGLDLVGGRELWRVAIDGACRAGTLTTAAGQLLTVDGCAAPQVAEFHDVETGELTNRWRPEDAGPELSVLPVGCGDGRSGCPAVRTTSGGVTRGWLVDLAGPEPVPVLDPAEVLLDGDVALVQLPGGGELVARSVRTGAELWRRSGPGSARIVAVQPGRVHLLTGSNELVTLNTLTGVQRSRFRLAWRHDTPNWRPGLVYAAHGLVAIERLTEGAAGEVPDPQYYAVAAPVILAAT